MDGDCRIFAVFNFMDTPPEHLIGTIALSYICEEYREKFAETARRAIETGQTRRLCYRVVMHPTKCWAGTWTPVEWCGIPAVLLTAHPFFCERCRDAVSDLTVSE